MARLLLAVAIMVCSLSAAGQKPVRAALTPPSERKPAPAFLLRDAEGRNVSLAGYRGKVLLLNFWATWCGGCKTELPWFQEFESKMSGRGLAVLGVSLDDEGWKVVKPFLDQAGVRIRMTLADRMVDKAYSLSQLPVTVLIDSEGRVAAKYIGLVDRANLEENLRALLP